MTKQKFIKEVEKELEMIRQNSTSTERGRLDFETFDHNDYEYCIYGQMTGHFDSERAKEIVPKTYIVARFIKSLRGYLPFEEQDFDRGTQVTPLEKYNYMVAHTNGEKSEKHLHIINYLKGYTEGVDLWF